MAADVAGAPRFDFGPDAADPSRGPYLRAAAAVAAALEAGDAGAARRAAECDCPPDASALVGAALRAGSAPALRALAEAGAGAELGCGDWVCAADSCLAWSPAGEPRAPSGWGAELRGIVAERLERAAARDCDCCGRGWGDPARLRVFRALLGGAAAAAWARGCEWPPDAARAMATARWSIGYARAAIAESRAGFSWEPAACDYSGPLCEQCSREWPDSAPGTTCARCGGCDESWHEGGECGDGDEAEFEERAEAIDRWCRDVRAILEGGDPELAAESCALAVRAAGGLPRGPRGPVASQRGDALQLPDARLLAETARSAGVLGGALAAGAE